MAEVIELSLFDHFSVRCYINTLFCFPTKISDDLESITGHLERSLVTFIKAYPF
jgi:hypothetical protein